jgi:ankyrin repeat protein
MLGTYAGEARVRFLTRGLRSVATVGLAAVALVVLVAFIIFQRIDHDPGGGVSDADTNSLSDAVVTSDLDLARTLLDLGVDVDTPRVHGFTPLMRAVIRDDVPMIGLLLGAGADLTAVAMEGLNPLHVAAEAGSAKAVGLLLDVGADVAVRSHNGMNALEHAAAAGSAEAIRVIAAAGVDLDGQSEITTQGHGYPVDVGSTALGIAARAGHIDAIIALLDAGARIDAPSVVGHTPLLVAIFAGQPPEVISALLEAGADPAVTAVCRTRCSYDPGDALTWAHRIGDPGVVPLIEAALDR